MATLSRRMHKPASVPSTTLGEAASGVRPKRANLSTLAPEVLPQATTWRAISTVGMAITHSRVAMSMSQVTWLALSTQPTSGGSNSIIVCQDIGIALARPACCTASSTTGPGSSSWYTRPSGSERSAGFM